MSRPADRWQDRAFCAYLAARPDVDVDLRLWFPVTGAGYARAREICGACLVRDECLEYALRTEVEFFRYGMWGGKTAKERSEIARTRAEVPR